MRTISAPLHELAEYGELYKARRRNPGMFLVSGCVTSQKSHMAYALSDGCRYTIIVLSNEEKAKKVYEEYRFLQEK